MSLNFGFTCPDIDEGLKDAKEYIKDNLFDLLAICRDEDWETEDVLKTYTEYIYGDITAAFERVRDCNSDLRKAAEEQVEELENDKENLDYRVAELEDERDELLDRIRELEKSIDFEIENNIHLQKEMGTLEDKLNNL